MSGLATITALAALAASAALVKPAAPSGPAVSQAPAQAPSQARASRLCLDGSGPRCVGRWGPPHNLCISCDSTCGMAELDCGSPASDEIGHATLIPVGPYQGRVLLWTRFHDQAARAPEPYDSLVWDPAAPDDDPVRISFNPAIGSSMGPFCAGHTWMVDGAGDLKLFCLGGDDFTGSCPGGICGSYLAYWFDPSTATWSGDPGIFPERTWYPSVILVEDERVPAQPRFVPFVLGGSDVNTVQACTNHLFDEAWTFDSPFTSGAAWNASSLGQFFQQYPRTFLLSDGDVLSIGHAVICEAPVAPYGGPPAHEVLAGDPENLSHALGPDPNAQGFAVHGLNYCNAAILHTLKDDWSFDPPNALDHYDLDRVVLTGGSHEAFEGEPPLDGTDDGESEAQPYTLELDAAAGQWTLKAASPRPRVFGNLVLLPDGTMLSVGGQETFPSAGSGDPGYRAVAERFDPMGPVDAGEWKDMAPRVGAGDGTFVPRGYHTVAVLLADGSVAMMGGVRNNTVGIDSGDVVEVYRPPYFFAGPRPSIDPPPATIRYGETFCLTSPDVDRIDRVALLGVSSVTHHFDYGQRYVELLFEPGSAACGGAGTIQVLAPPLPALAPEGDYLLYVVEDGDPSVPSEGVFVELRYP